MGNYMISIWLFFFVLFCLLFFLLFLFVLLILVCLSPFTTEKYVSLIPEGGNKVVYLEGARGRAGPGTQSRTTGRRPAHPWLLAGWLVTADQQGGQTCVFFVLLVFVHVFCCMYVNLM